MTWDKEQEEIAQKKVLENSSVTAPTEQIDKYDKEANKYWDKFYGIHQNRLGYLLAKKYQR